MMRSLRSPFWVLGHVLVVAVLVGFPLLGLWQLDRHEERQAINAALEQRPREPALTARDLSADADALAYRRVELSGTWEPGDEVLLSARPLDGRPGHHVLTPLRLEDGSAVLVDRGWVPYEIEEPPVAEAPPPEGPVDVTGLALPPESARRAGRLTGEGHEPDELARGQRIEFVSHRDPTVVGRSLGEPLPEVVIQADAGARASDGALPATVPPPEPTDGNHFSYAVQWFLFTGVVAVGYPLLLRQRRKGGGDADGVAEPEPAAAVDVRSHQPQE